jgi:hypothetical protein
MKKVLLLAALSALPACIAEAPPQRQPIPVYDRANPGPWCSAALDLLGNPFGTPAEYQALLIAMENRGCLG